MLKLVLVIIGLITGVGGLAAGGIAAAFAGGVLKVPEVVEVGNAWGAVDQETTEVLTAIVLHNPNAVGLGLNNVSIAADAYLNDVPIAQGETDGVRLPEGTSTTALVTRIDNTRIAEWWPTHVANGERSTLRIVPRGKTSVLGWGLNVPGPGITQSFETDLLAGASSNEPQTFALPLGYGVTVKSTHVWWGEATSERTDIDGTAVVYNDSPLPIAISEIAFQFIMNGVVVGQGTTQDPAVLLPGRDTVVPLELSITNARLIEWWPTHIQAGEHTRYRIDLDAVLVFTLPLLGEQAVPLRVMTIQDEFQTNILGN